MKKMYSFKTLTRTMQSFLAMVLVTLMAVSSVVAQTTYSHTFTAKMWSALDAQTLSDVQWTADGTANDPTDLFFGYDATKGQQFGKGANPFTALTLTTTGITGTITSVKVNTSGANSINATFKVKVGDTYFTSGDADNIAVTNNATEYTFTGSASGAVVLEWAQTSSKAIYVKSIEITYTPAAVAVAAPVFAPAAGLYYAPQSVAITCATTDAIIHYTLDGTAPTAESPIYTAPIAVDTNTTIKAIAIKGTDNSTVATATYTFPVEVANIAAFKAANTATNSTVYKIAGDVTFVFENGANIYVQDTTGGLLIYDNPGINAVTGTYAEGDVITGGVFGTYTLYNGLVELVPTKDLAASTTNTGAVAPILATVADIKANYGQFESKLVTLSDVTFAAGSFNTNSATNINVQQDGETMQVRNVYKTLEMSIPAGFVADVTGFVLRYNNNFQIAPRANDDIEFAPATLPYTVDFDQNTDPGFAINNGNNTNQWYIGQPQGFDNNKLFISSNDGVTNKYDVTAASTVTASRGITIPTNGAVLAFNSRVNGEAGHDMLNVYLYNYTNNILSTDPSWQASVSGENDWTEHTFPISPESAGEAMLVFEWVNNNRNGEQYPAAIDNISITEAVCAQPIALSANVNGENAVITWTAADTTQNAWTLEYKLEDHNEWYSMNTTEPTVTLSGLQGSSTYDVRVKANCGNESSEWTVGTFAVSCLNGTMVQKQIQLGEGTNNATMYPVAGWYYHSYAQQVFTKEELAEKGVTEGSKILSISFNFSNPSALHKPMKMALANTTSTVASGFISHNDFTQVYATDDINFNDTWVTINFTTPFTYTGNNLAIATLMNYEDRDVDNWTYASGNNFYCTTVSSDLVRYAYNDNSGSAYEIEFNNDGLPVANNLVLEGTKVTNRNNIKFTANIINCNDQLACVAPDSLTVTDITPNSAVFSWNGEATDYSFEYKTGEADWTVVNVSANTYTLSGLSQKTDYVVRVKAICGENNYSLYSDEVPFTTTSVCPVVTNIETSNLSTTTTITWTPGGNENEWTLRFRPVGTTDWVTLHISGLSTTTFGGLQDQTDYEVEIMALCDPTDEANQSSWAHYEFTSGCAPFEMPYLEEFTTTEVPNCWTDENITFDGATAAATEAGQWLMTPPIQVPAVGNTYIVLDVQGAFSVQASYRGTMLNRFSEIATVTDNGEMNHVIIQVPNDYKDKAVNFLFLANDEVEIEAVEFTQCPFIPTKLTVANPTNEQVELSWTGSNNHGWVLNYAQSQNGPWTAVNLEQTGDTVNYTLTDLEGNTTYYFYVQTICEGGFTSEASDMATITTRCDAVSVPYTKFDSYSNANYDCWSTLYTGTYAGNGALISSAGNKARLYNYYDRTLDGQDITAFGDVYAILPTMDTTLNALQISFTAEKRLNNVDGNFQLGYVTNINDPIHTFIPLENYTAPYSPAADYTYILNNVEENGNLAFRVRKASTTQDILISNILVEYIPACQKPHNLEVTAIKEDSVKLTWGIIGIQRNWDIKYIKGYDFDPDNAGTLVTANKQPRYIGNMEYGAHYTFYIRNHCSGENSLWVGPFSYTHEIRYNIANTSNVTTCHGKVVYQKDSVETNVMTLQASSPNSWVALTGNVNMGNDTLYVYEGPAVEASKCIATLFGTHNDLYIIPICESELTLQLKKAANSNPTLNLEISCEAVPTCSAPTNLEYDSLTAVLSWKAGCWGTAESYTIVVESELGSSNPMTLTSTDTSVVIPIENLSNGTYYATVNPVCNGQLGIGTWITFDRVACADPTNLTATPVNTSNGYTAQLTWSGNAGLGYEVGYKLHDAYTWTTVNNVTTNSYTTPVLDDKVVYDFRVKAICNASDQSGYVTTSMEVPCANPTIYPEADVTLGTGTTTNSYLPTYPFYNYSLTQQIYTSDEIRNNGPISSVSFYNAGSVKTRTLSVYMVHTTKSTFTGSTDWVNISQDDLVYTGSVQLVANDWTTINFDNNFSYNGTDNLVLIVDDNTGSYQSGFSGRVYDAAGNQAIRIYSDGTNYDPFNPSSYTGTLMAVKNQVKFHFGGEFCTPTVTCSTPSNVAVVEKSGNSVTFNWNRGGNETSWTVVYTLDNQEYSATTNDTVYTITGLQGSTQYSIPVHVYANCDATHQSTGVSGTLIFSTPCPAITTFPWNEDFESFPAYTSTSYSSTYKLNDPCWINEHISGNGSYLFQVTSYTQSGNNTHKLQLPDMTSGTMTKLVLPLMDLPNNYYQFVLDVLRNTNSSSYAGEGIRVFVSTNGEIEGATELAFISRNYNTTDGNLIPQESGTGWYTYEIPVGVSGPCYIILRGESKYGAATYMDNFEVSAMPTCVKPTNLAYANDTLSWTPTASIAGTPSNFNVRYRVQGESDWTTVAVSNPYMLCTNFTEGSTYEVQVQADCGEGDYSDWTDVYTFYKPCAISCDLVLDLDDSYGDGWNNASIKVYQDDDLLGTYTVPASSYSAHYTVSICNGKSVSLVWVPGNYDSECSMVITFAGDEIYSGGAPSAGTFASSACSSCSMPTNFNIDFATGTLSWSAGSNGTPESYILSYRVAGAEEFTTVTVTDTFYSFGTLPEGTTYELQMQTNCSPSEGQSPLTPLMTFTTPVNCNNALTVPFVETFESSSPSLSCWTAFDADRDGYFWGIMNDNTLSHDGNRMAYSVSWDGSVGALTPDNWLVSPAVQITDANAQLRYWIRNYSNSYPENYSVYVSTGNTPSAFLQTTPLVDSVTLDNENYVERVFDLSAYYGQTIYVAFRHFGSEDQEAILLDDVSIIPNPCAPITEFPWTEDFEEFPANTSTGYSASYVLNETCWENEHISGGGTGLFQICSYAQSSNTTHKLQLPDMTSGTMTKLVLPAMKLPTANYQFVLDVLRNSSTSNYGEGIRVFVSTNGEIEGATELAFISRSYTTSDGNLIPVETASGWYRYELPIGISGPCYIILQGESKYGSATYMDNFVVNEIPSCFAPTNANVSNITYNSAKVNWNDKRHQGNYAVEYMAEGDTTWTTVAGDSTLTTTLTNLQSSTTYTVRVKAVCGENDESEYSNEVTFTTPCIGGGYFIAGTGTAYSSNYYSPFYYSNNKSYTEMLYLASEINQKGTINSIAFDCAVTGSNAVDTFRIYMATTNKTSLTTGLANWMPIEEMTLVYEGVDITIGAEKGWETFTFNTPFEYNGTDNLLVAISKNASTYNSSLRYNATSISGRVHYQSSVVTPTAAGSSSSYRSNAQFMICPPDYDLAVDSIAPIADNCDLSDAKIVVRLRNNSFINAVNGFTVNYTVNGAETPVSETVNATILPQETYIHTFATTPAFTDGSNDIVVNVVYEEDEEETNNTISLLDIRQVVPATVPYDQDFSNVVMGRDAWTQGTENNNPNIWKNNGGVMTFMDNDTLDSKNYFITHCIEIPAGQMQVSYDYNALSNMPEGLNVYMGTTPDIASMTLIGSHSDFTKEAEDYTYDYLFDNAVEGVYYFAVEATSQKGNMGVTFDNLKIMPMVDVIVTSGPNGTVSPLGTVKIPYNGSLTINIIPNEMYHTAGVWVDGERVMNEDPYNASFMMYTLDNITETHTINVEFKMEFHIFKYAYNYNSQYPEVGGQIVGNLIDTTLNPSGGMVQFIADEHYTMHSLVMGITPPASEGAIIDGTNVMDAVTYDPATRTYTYVIDTMYVSNYYVQACFKRDTVAINYAVVTGAGVFDGVTVNAGDTHDTYVDYGTDFTSTILPADGYYNMGVTVNGEDKGIIDHYDFDSVITTQYVTAQFGHMVTANIMNINGAEYFGSDAARGTIAPDTQMVLSGSSCSVSGTVEEHFHLSNFFVNGVDNLENLVWNGNAFTYTIDSLVANTEILAVVRIDSVAIYYTVDGGNGYVNGNLMEALAYDTLYLNYGSDFMSQFAAADGYHIVNVTVNGTAYDEIPMWLTENIQFAQYITVTFALNEYDITTAAHGNGSVTPGVHVVYDPNSSYTFTATPAVGSHISQILRNNESLVIENPEAAYTETIAPVLNDYNYVAYFEPNIYTVTASAGDGGTIDPYGAQNYEYGATPTFTITPAAGYEVDEVTVDGNVVTLTNGAYTFAPMTCNHTINATFHALTYTINATAGAHGTVTPAGENVVAYGAMPVYTITPATGYEIADVTVDNVSVGAVSSYVFEPVTANHTIAATFSALTYTITATAGANGTITPAGVNTVTYGATPTFTVTPATGYEVDYVLVDGQAVTLTNGAYTFAAVTANHEIYVAFKLSTYTIMVTAPNHGTITPSGVITVNYGATPTFTITPATGYEVTAITVNGSNVIANATEDIVTGAYTYTFPAVTANRTLTATMTALTYTITKNAGANGTINGSATVNYGANATYTIVPNDGYQVNNVTVDGINMGAIGSYTFYNVTANHTIAATFKVEDCVIPSNLQTIHIDSTSATLTWYHPGADSYDIQYKQVAATTWTLVQNVPGFTYNLTNLQSSTSYVWKIKANTVGCTDTDWSNATSFTTSAGPAPQVGVADYVKNHVNVYAEHNRVHIVNDYSVDINNVSIYDMYGKVIYSGAAISNPEVIELNVAQGTYVVRLTTEQGPAVYKVHITR